jgi:asparagine synthase (glutamine-hydrolysing)
MCGISGIINKNRSVVKFEEIKKINDLISHRGPDGEGFYNGENFAFGHRRLSIIDLTDGGRQPMPYLDKYWITYNGEVYNYIELREELLTNGYKFGSGSDTEVILAAYDKWGKDCLQKFNGMWAFAIYDITKQNIFFARDRFGVKPLYYTNTPDKFIFGSEIKQLIALQHEVRANRNVIVESLLTNVDGHTEETFFEGVNKFPQGHFAQYDLLDNAFQIERYYTLNINEDVKKMPFEEARKQLRMLFEDSVKLRLRSDVRVGTCLSGGLDSSATSAMGSIHYNYNKQTLGKFIGIHAKSQDSESDESNFAKIVSDYLDLDLHIVEPKMDNFVGKIDELIYTQEEPFGSPSMFMGWHVFEKAKELGCKVMLNGQGGDEVLLGYERYYASYLFSLPISKFIQQSREVSLNSKLTFKEVILYYFYFTNKAIRIRRLKKRSYLKEQVKSLFDFKTIKESAQSFKDIYKMQLFETGTIQLPHLLRYEDRNSMRHSIETRLPFLDYRFVEFSISMPPSYKITKGWTKYILRKAVEDLLPESIIWRKDKKGFEAPEKSWIGGATSMMKAEIKKSKILNELVDTERLLSDFDKMPFRRRWVYFMIASWERKFNVV